MYQQKICYIDLYKNGLKCGNMGHVKLEWEDDRYRFQTGLCRLEKQTLVSLHLRRDGKHDGVAKIDAAEPQTVASSNVSIMGAEGTDEKLSDIAIVHGKGNYRSDWIPLWGDEQQMIFVASGGTYGICLLPQMKKVQPEKLPADSGQSEAVANAVQPEKIADAGREETAADSMQVDAVQPEYAADAVQAEGAANAVQAEGIADAVQENPDEKIPKGTADGAGHTKKENGSEHEEVSHTAKPAEATGSGKYAKVMDFAEFLANKAEQKNAQLHREVTSTANVAKESKSEIKPPIFWPVHRAETERGREAKENQKKDLAESKLSESKWEQLCSMYETVRPIAGDITFIKIRPEDFVILRQEYQKLVRNSFLLHGYYSYRYLLLGKYPDKYYLGVPGIMHEQEKMAAAMFGFVGFERALPQDGQNNDGMTFGYYMMEVAI